MNIGVNLVSLFPGKIGGAEQYVRNLIREMSALKEDHLYLFLNSIALQTFENYEDVILCCISDSENRDTQMNFYIDYYNIDIIFAPLFFMAPTPCCIPSVASILDVQHEFFPQYFDAKVLKDIKRSTKATLEQVDGIITISNYSKDTIIDKYKISEEKIRVTYLNSDGCFDEDINQKRKEEIKSKIGCNYIFYPANTWPHKNHINLLKAYKILKEKYHSNLKLVFTGDSKQQKKNIESFINDNGLKDDIKYLGYLPQEDMPYVFAGADIMAFPSVFEGFGIPLVEAMKAGVAIACSQCGSIPEVAQDAALYFDAYDPKDIAEKLHLLLQNAELRMQLIEKGKKIARNYSWEKCAQDTRMYLYQIYKNKYKKENLNTYDEEYPLVSVITPSFNQGKFIKDTIESVLSQDYPNIEYIIMDGGSGDETIEILKSYGTRIKWYSEKDKGQADAVNKGIKLAKGKIIGWVNSDDTYLEGAISKIVNYMKNHPNTDLVYGEGYYTDIDGNITSRYLTEKYSYKRLAEQCIICQPTAFFTKSIVNEVGMLDVNHQLSMDYELWMRIAKQGKISYIPEYLATSRMYEDNKTLSRRREVFIETCYAVKRHFGYVPISWIDGYTDFLCEGTRGFKYCVKNVWLFTKYNWDNKQYCKSEMSNILKNRLGILKRIFLKEKDTKKFKGRYSDNWISFVYKEKIESINNYSKITISINNQWPLKKPLAIFIFVNGRYYLRRVLKENGRIEIVVNLKKIRKEEGELMICASKTFCPALINGSTDTRNLSCQIEKITYR